MENQKAQESQGIKNFLYKVLCGFFLGVSIFAPGFSGSVIAIILGIYQDLLRIASNPFKKLKQNVLFCIPLGIGAVISGVLFIITFKYLFDTYEKATYLLFVGLIAGNLPIIFMEVKKSKFKKRYLTGGVGAFAAALALGIFATVAKHPSGAEGFTAELPTLAFGGFAGGVTALIPGMSVSMVLIITGVYNQLIYAVESLLRMDFTHLVPVLLFIICAVIGLVLTSKAIKYIFDKHPGFANTTVLGFMAGSLIGIFIQSLKIEDINFNWVLGGVMLVIGLGISMLFVAMGKNMNKE